jgi:hypothetical protein
MARPIYGGWITYTAHLSLKNNIPIFKVGKRSEKSKRNFGYGTNYQLLKIEDICKKENLIITALDKHYYEYLHLFPKRTKLVIHDPTELKTTKKSPNPLIVNNLLQHFDIITIRETVQKYIKEQFNIDSEYCPHPFFHYDKGNYESMDNFAISISRIDYDKNTDIILKCNKLLDEDKQIKIFGAENRMYVHHKLKELDFQKYWKGKYPKTLPLLYDDKDILSNCKYMIDLSTIKDDGGGTQYTFLEAIYNDCILILHNDWINKGTTFKNNVNCLSVKNKIELKDILNGEREYDKDMILKNARDILENHK